MRVWATQAWPVFMIPENTNMGTEAARSTSSSRMAADFPPSSRVHGLSISAARLPISLPTAELPVKEKMSMSGLEVSACPVSIPPGTIDSTPSGKPASANTSAKAFALSGVSAAGLSTTVQPASSAGPSLLIAKNSGTFHATIAPTTPSGSRWTMVCP